MTNIPPTNPFTSSDKINKAGKLSPKKLFSPETREKISKRYFYLSRRARPLKALLYNLPKMGLYKALYPNPYCNTIKSVASDREFQKKLTEDLGGIDRRLHDEIDTYVEGQGVYDDRAGIKEGLLESPVKEFTKNDSRLHYVEMSHTDRPNERKTIIFCHGNGHKIDAFRKHMLYAYKRGYNVVALGYSEFLKPKRVNINTDLDILETVKAYIEKKLNEGMKPGQMIFNGHSLGGAILNCALEMFCEAREEELHKFNEPFDTVAPIAAFSAIKDRVSEDLYKILKKIIPTFSKHDAQKIIETQKKLQKYSHDFYNSKKALKKVSPHVKEIKIFHPKWDKKTPLTNARKIEAYLQEHNVPNFTFEAYESPFGEGYGVEGYRRYHEKHHEQTGSYALRDRSSEHSFKVDVPTLDIEGETQRQLEWFYDRVWGANPWYKTPETNVPNSRETARIG